MADKVKLLEQQKAELQQQLEVTQADDIQKTNLLIEVKRELEQMSGKVVEVRRMQSEFESAIFADEIDLEEKIFFELDSLRQILEKSREKTEQAATATAEDGQIATDRKTIEDLRRELDEREQEIAALRYEMNRLQRESTEQQQALEEHLAAGHAAETNLPEFRQEVEESRAIELGRRFQSRQRVEEDRIAQSYPPNNWRSNRGIHWEPEKNLQRRNGIDWAYYFIGSPEQIDLAHRRREILSHKRTFHVPESVLITGRLPWMFRRISTDETNIYLGNDLWSKEIISAHKWSASSFRFGVDENGRTFLRIKDPQAFWKEGCCLIIEIR